MSNWSLQEVRRQIAELARSGTGGKSVIDLLCMSGVCAPAECDVLDYKREVSVDEVGVAEACRDTAAFYNMYGGFIVVGVEEDDNERFNIIGAERGYDIEQLKNKLRDVTGE